MRIYCPGHVGVCGNKRADRLASTAPLVKTITMDKKKKEIVKKIDERIRILDDTSRTE